jgi:hypothetical protein
MIDVITQILVRAGSCGQTVVKVVTGNGDPTLAQEGRDRLQFV